VRWFVTVALIKSCPAVTAIGEEKLIASPALSAVAVGRPTEPAPVKVRSCESDFTQEPLNPAPPAGWPANPPNLYGGTWKLSKAKTPGNGELVDCVVVRLTVAEIVESWYLSPPYTAVKACEPFEGADRTRTAAPLLSVPVPTTLLPSLNVTVPVVAAGVTVAERVMAWPPVEGLGETVSVITAGGVIVVRLTVAEVVESWYLSPPYTAVKACEPFEGADRTRTAAPLLSVPVPTTLLPSLNVTVPVAAVGVTAAERVIAWPPVEGFGEAVKVIMAGVATVIRLTVAEVVES
jgi:hypothetical protein